MPGQPSLQAVVAEVYPLIADRNKPRVPSLKRAYRRLRKFASESGIAKEHLMDDEEWADMALRVMVTFDISEEERAETTARIILARHVIAAVPLHEPFT